MKSVYFLLTSLAITFLISFNLVLGCNAVYKSVYWDDQCTGDPERWFGFAIQVLSFADVTCAVGPSSQYGHGNEYWQRSIFGSCEKKSNVVWRNISKNQWPPGALEGEICEARSGVDCSGIFGGTPDYRFDTDDWGCVHCINIPPYGKRQGEIDKCGSRDPATYECEEACGADPECDELLPGTGNCDGNCNYLTTCEGDINDDGVVDIMDLATVAQPYGSKEGDPEYNPDADLSNDGLVDIRDIAIVSREYGKDCL